ncbi:MAG: XrtA system polysaccharide chain length determinant [Candidatus Acidiferrales bacterium]
MSQRQLTPADYLAMLRRRWVLIAVLTFAGGPLAYGVSKLLPNRYKSQTLVLVDAPTVPSDVVRPVVTADLNQRLASMQEQILSRTRLEPIIRQFGLYPKDINVKPMEELVARLRKDVEVTPVEAMAETRSQELPGFHVSATLDNAKTAQAVCATITSMFIQESVHLREQRSEDTTTFLSQQLADAKAKLDEQDAKLATFKSQHLNALPDEEQTNLNLLNNLTTQLDAATQALARAQQDKSFAESLLAPQLEEWKTTQAGRNPNTLQQQLATLETQLTNLRARYTDDYPDVIKAKSDIASLKKQMADSNTARSNPDDPKDANTSIEPPQIQQLRAQIHAHEQAIAAKQAEQDQIKQQIAVYQARVQSSPAIEQQYKELTRDYQTASDFYNDLLKKRDQSAMATDLEHQQQGEQFRILDPANLPDKPTFPNRRLFALGGFVGGMALGFGLAFLIEVRDTSLKTESDVEFTLHLPVLAMVPAIKSADGKRALNGHSTSADAGLSAGLRA